MAAEAQRVWLHEKYSSDYNPIEGVWEQTKNLTTHNRFLTTDERDAELTATFKTSTPTRSSSSVM